MLGFDPEELFGFSPQEKTQENTLGEDYLKAKQDLLNLMLDFDRLSEEQEPTKEQREQYQDGVNTYLELMQHSLQDRERTEREAGNEAAASQSAAMRDKIASRGALIWEGGTAKEEPSESLTREREAKRELETLRGLRDKLHSLQDNGVFRRVFNGREVQRYDTMMHSMDVYVRRLEYQVLGQKDPDATPENEAQGLTQQELLRIAKSNFNVDADLYLQLKPKGPGSDPRDLERFETVMKGIALADSPAAMNNRLGIINSARPERDRIDPGHLQDPMAERQKQRSAEWEEKRLQQKSELASSKQRSAQLRRKEQDIERREEARRIREYFKEKQASLSGKMRELMPLGTGDRTSPMGREEYKTLAAVSIYIRGVQDFTDKLNSERNMGLKQLREQKKLLDNALDRQKMEQGIQAILNSPRFRKLMDECGLNGSGKEFDRQKISRVLTEQPTALYEAYQKSTTLAAYTDQGATMRRLKDQFYGMGAKITENGIKASRRTKKDELSGTSQFDPSRKNARFDGVKKKEKTETQRDDRERGLKK